VAALDEKVAFEAMRHFLEAHWERGGRTSDDLAILLGELSTDLWADGMPGDPAQWQDWLNAIDRATGQ
jgi:hypothetical protein